MKRPFFDRLPSVRDLSFWHFQIAGWLLFWCGDLVFILLQNIPPQETAAQALDAPLGFALGLVLRRVYLRLNYRKLTIPVLIVYILAWSVAWSLVWHGLMTATRYLLLGPEAAYYLWSLDFAPRWLSRIMPIWLGWSALYFGIRYGKDLEVERERARAAHSLARQARLRMLRYQVHPHFLFNALNSVRALIDEDRTNAKAMVAGLTEFLRYTLRTQDDGEMPLERELEAIRHYLAVEKKRFEDKLDVEFDVEEEARRLPVLSFLIHPFVENAIKYGMRTSPMPLRIRIRASAMNGSLRLVISNSGSWVSPRARPDVSSDGTGTGLENVRARLENAYPHAYHLESIEQDGWVNAILDIHRPPVAS